MCKLFIVSLHLNNTIYLLTDPTELVSWLVDELQSDTIKHVDISDDTFKSNKSTVILRFTFDSKIGKMQITVKIYIYIKFHINHRKTK